MRFYFVVVFTYIIILKHSAAFIHHVKPIFTGRLTHNLVTINIIIDIVSLVCECPVKSLRPTRV